jgi:uncharacterized membrane protein YkvA (DUF1232 family)
VILRTILKVIPGGSWLVSAFFAFRDTRTPVTVKIAVVLGLLYVLLPFDLIPDIMPLLGLGDDAIVGLGCIRLLKPHITEEHTEFANAWLNGELA